jgi:hypothetical protein
MKILQYIFIVVFAISFANADYIGDAKNLRVYDTSADIVWTDNNAIDENNITKFTWIGAYAYCENLDLNGSTDWHLPNINQLFSLSDKTRYNPAIDNTVFKNIKTDKAYWSSTVNMQNQNYALAVDFYDGKIVSENKTTLLYVRCFRNWGAR